MANYIVPIFLFVLLIYAYAKNINAYEAFAGGAKESVNLCINTFPYLCAIFVAVELFKLSGLAGELSKLFAPILQFFGMPAELAEFMVLRPFSGSGSLAYLSEIFSTFGVDSFVSKCACVIMSCSETTFYIVAIYFSTTKIKKLRYTIPVCLLATFVGSVIACLVCRII
ncbi:MAG: spore maturation protein [Clostridia bacterium]|nr:spore maturation protein [Clostridia bacterium]